MATCYHITEQVGSTMVPCNRTAVAEGKHTNCCTENYLCLSNGMCRAPKLTSASNYYWRIGCTDKTFSDPACGKYCAQVPFSVADDNWRQLIWQCPGAESYCCNTGRQTPYEERVGQTNTSCCDKKDLTFKAPDPHVVGTASSLGSSFSIAASTAPASWPRSRGTSSSSLTLAASITPSSSVDATRVTPASASKSTALPIGLGVGIGIGGIIVACVGLVYIWQRKRRLDQHDGKQMQAPVEMETSPSEMMTMERPTELISPTVQR